MVPRLAATILHLDEGNAATTSGLRRIHTPRLRKFLHFTKCSHGFQRMAERRWDGFAQAGGKRHPAALAVSKRVNSTRAPDYDLTLIEPAGV